MAIAWDSSMTTGVASVDAQHKELFRQVAALKDAMTQGKGRDEIQRLLEFLAKYVLKHFAEEEQQMEQYACPAAAANKAAHAEFVAQLKQFKSRFDAQGAVATLVIELHDVATRWLVQHIKGIDTQLLAAVKNRTLQGAAC